MEPPTPTENRFFRQSHSHAQEAPPSPNQNDINNSQQQQALRIQTQPQNFHPSFPQKIQTLSLPLAPFVQLTTGLVHPHFPETLLHFWLLTSSQLDELAAFYHQSPPCEWASHYPCPIVYHPDMPLEEKRRKIGKFIGLRGCETPTIQNQDENGHALWGRAKTEEEILEDARRARLSQEEEEIRRKMGWY